MATFQTNVLRGEAYPNCSACSPKILEAYRKSGWKFVQRALREKDYVADLSGLAEVQRRAEERVKEVMDDSEGDDF
jgi:ubiquitin-like modifier-activating enzyme ATG7